MTDELPPTLPSDIIRMVIGIATHENHSIKEMRLVSYLWKDIVDEEFARLSNLPPIDELVITPSADVAGEEYLLIVYLKIKEADKIPLHHLYNFGFSRVEESDMEENKDKNNVTLKKKIRLNDVVEGRTHALSSIKTINRVVIKELSEQRIKYLPKIFKRIEADEIVFEEHKLIATYSGFILKLIRQWSAARVQLVIKDSLISRNVFLLEIAELVEVLKIKQITSYIPGHRTAYLIDNYGVQTICKMFEKRVSKIKIEHHNVLFGVKPDDLQELINFVLRCKAKKPWLEINAYNFDNGLRGQYSFSRIWKKFVMKVFEIPSEKQNFVKSVISVKHRSRAKEAFE